MPTAPCDGWDEHAGPAAVLRWPPRTPHLQHHHLCTTTRSPAGLYLAGRPQPVHRHGLRRRRLHRRAEHARGQRQEELGGPGCVRVPRRRHPHREPRCTRWAGSTSLCPALHSSLVLPCTGPSPPQPRVACPAPCLVPQYFKSWPNAAVPDTAIYPASEFAGCGVADAGQYSVSLAWQKKVSQLSGRAGPGV